MCNKIGYPSKSAAVRESKFIMMESRNRLKQKRVGKPGKSKLWPYECPVCGEWHLTSMSRNEARNHKRKAKKKERANGARSE